MRMPNAPRDPENQRPGQVGGRVGQHAGRIRDDHPAVARGRRVDVVIAYGGVRDDLQLGARVDDRLVDGIGDHADKRLFAGDSRNELVVRHDVDALFAVLIDVTDRFEPGENRRGDLSGEQYERSRAAQCPIDLQ
jgi:hypothetical protein